MLQQLYKNSRNKICAIAGFVFLFLFSFSIFGEENFSSPQFQQNSSSQSPETNRLQKFKAAARAKLVKKLTNKNGKPSSILILSPVDYTTLQQPQLITETIKNAVQVYDKKIEVGSTQYQMQALNLEQFRKATLKLKTDIIIAPVMYPTNIDVYLYDSRAPLQIYAHSEPIAGAAQYELTKEAAQYYIKTLIRRTLYRYIKNQFYELPRENSPTVLKSEIPRYIASHETLEMVNHDAHANWYASAGVGAALSSGQSSGKYWNSNLVSLELGRRVRESAFVSLNLDMFAYNVVGGFAKYMFVDKNKSFKLSAGLGLAYAMWSKTLDWDQNNSIRNGTILAAPDLTVLLPIGDVYLKAEGRVYVGVNRRAFVLTLLPGLLIQF